MATNSSLAISDSEKLGYLAEQILAIRSKWLDVVTQERAMMKFEVGKEIRTSPLFNEGKRQRKDLMLRLSRELGAGWSTETLDDCVDYAIWLPGKYPKLHEVAAVHQSLAEYGGWTKIREEFHSLSTGKKNAYGGTETEEAVHKSKCTHCPKHCP